MAQHYFLWAHGEDRPGIVAAVAKELFGLGSNLEDSSMMRLGSEFAMFLIFSADKKIPIVRLNAALKNLRGRRLTIGIKEISPRQARFRRATRSAFLVSVHGPDRPGIVYRVTQALARREFNITDLSTHRTTDGTSPGFILFIEGELASSRALSPLKKELARLAHDLGTTVDVRSVDAAPL